MKYLLNTLALVVLAAAVTGFVCFRMNSDPQLHAAAATGDAMQWLRSDFHLTDAQFAAIRQLHESYAGTCAEHCRMIQEASRARDALAAARGDAAALVAANRELQDLRRNCETAIARHVRQVAALMPPEDGRRYLALVLPKIAAFDHRAAPDLRLNHTR
jgi:hypothetical protein